MKIWKITSNERNISINTIDYVDDVLIELKGESLVNKWNPFEVVIEGNKKKFKEFIDFVPETFVINEKTMNILTPFLEDKVEYLPIIHQEHLFYLCNIVNLIDCVDKEKSIAKYTKKSQKFIGYEKIIFKKNFLENKKKIRIFKIPELATKSCFVSDEFKEFIEKSGLYGPDFDLVWDSEIDQETELHQQQNYNEYINSVNNSFDLSMSWEQAMNCVNQNEAVVSDRWKLKLDQDLNILLGQLNMDLQYDFVSPKYIPPILLDLKWKKA